ncbi:zinc dependent phospholipase C family protein [Proteocatella sphenisci]|uniref:zinc dependent phospholipase C family protein n=1 Tax=Proteocatella sphenisci TaxID=181070 RepID=UPI00048F0DEB|nr:zinc dependent phospholipase C family protein [Proteocatella sphenisci]
MLIPTHMRMSELIYSNIEKNTDFSPGKLTFKTGNMSPDMPFYHKHLKHYKHQNFDYILQMINDLSSVDPTESITTLNVYSYRLGVIAHYVCDYFCLPHHDRNTYQDNLKKHLIYEKDLHKAVKQYIHKNEIQFNESLSVEGSDLISFFDDLLQKYLYEANSFENDLNYAISAASMICSAIVLSSLNVNAEELVYA